MSVKKTQDPIIVTPPKPLPIPSPTYSLEEGEQGTSEAEVVTEPKARFVGSTHEEIPEWPGPYHVTENGLYETAGYEFSTNLLVEVPPKGLTEITITENGVYKPDDYDGYSKVTVSVQPILEELEVTENGEYLPTSPTQGFSKVTVAVQPPLVVDPVLENNSWEVIRQVCEAGEAADYWALGDTKTDTGTDNVTRTFRICDMSGLYGKHVVFEQVELTNDRYVWNASSNVDEDNCYNNYNISQMRSTHLPALLAKYSSDLQGQLTNTTYKVAKNGTSTTLLDLTDKLFLPAERELFASRSYSRAEEWNALTRFALYALPANDNNTFRIKYDPSNTARAYWERSPYSGLAYTVCYVNTDGGASSYFAYSDYRVAPCFAW